LVGVRQGLNHQPQLINMRVAVADFPALFDIGQSVPQRQQLSRVACSSSFDTTTISRSFTAIGGSRQRMIPSLPMM
jgi:hypothetical protein